MENNQNQEELSFEELTEMSDFTLETKVEKKEDLEISFSEEEKEKEKEEEKEVIKEKEGEIPKFEEKKKEVVKKENRNDFYSELLKDKLETGDWQDTLIELEDGTEVKLSELDSLDKDTYKSIEKAIKADKDKSFKENYVELEGLDETRRKLINIIKNGDLDTAKELFENPASLQEPFKDYDNDNDSHNEQVLSWYYTSIGHSKKETESLIRVAKEDLNLDVNAQKIVDFQRNSFQKKLADKETSILEGRQKEAVEIKAYKKDLSESLKEEGLTDVMIRKFVDVATKKDQEGNFEIDSIYEETMKDPKKAKELIYFMLDRENYLNKATSKAKKEVQLDTLKKVRLIQETTKVDKVKKQEEEREQSGLAQLQFD